MIRPCVAKIVAAPPIFLPKELLPKDDLNSMVYF